MCDFLIEFLMCHCCNLKLKGLVDLVIKRISKKTQNVLNYLVCITKICTSVFAPVEMYSVQSFAPYV